MNGSNDDIEIEIDDETGEGRRADASDADEKRVDADHDPVQSPAGGANGDHERSETSESAERLADELGRVDIRTTPEGYVEGRITGLTEVDERTVRLTVRLPNDRSRSFDLEKPIPWSRDHLLARLVEDVGYDAASIEHAVGEPVYLERTDVRDTAETWRTAATRRLGYALFARLGDRFDVTVAPATEWELVDPRDRPSRRNRSRISLPPLAGFATVLLGAVLAAAGAVIGATGGLTLSIAGIAATLPGLLIVLLGLALLSDLQ